MHKGRYDTMRCDAITHSSIHPSFNQSINQSCLHLSLSLELVHLSTPCLTYLSTAAATAPITHSFYALPTHPSRFHLSKSERKRESDNTSTYLTTARTYRATQNLTFFITIIICFFLLDGAKTDRQDRAETKRPIGPNEPNRKASE